MSQKGLASFLGPIVQTIQISLNSNNTSFYEYKFFFNWRKNGEISEDRSTNAAIDIRRADATQSSSFFIASPTVTEHNFQEGPILMILIISKKKFQIRPARGV